MANQLKHFMCNSCEDATAVINNPDTRRERHTCEWCKRERWGRFVGNTPREPISTEAVKKWV